MAATRLTPPRAVPVKDNDLDRVQAAVRAAVSAIINKPTVDSQLVTTGLTATTGAQTLTFTHQLGRQPSGLHVVSCPALVSQVGQHAFSVNTASVTIVTATATTGTVTAAVF